MRAKHHRHGKYRSRPLRLEQLERRELLAGDVFLVNFQSASSFTPNRHLADAGETFGVQAGGQTYGWSSDQTDQALERGTNFDQRRDTLLQIEAGEFWEFQLPDGMYEVTASVGDPTSGSTHTLSVEGASMFNALPLPANGFQEGAVTVQVSDGRLTLDVGLAPNQATRLNYVYIVSVASAPNSNPASPFITEPTFAGQVVNPSDVHMEAVGFSDPDGDLHANTDWQIWVDDGNGQPDELVWETLGIPGVERLHTHLGDGIFVGSHAGSAELNYATDYVMRVRFRDSAGAVSPWASRSFSTGVASEAFPLELEDIATAPAPSWTNALSNDIVLPGPAGEKPHLRVESATGDLLLSIAGNDGGTNTIDNPPGLPAHFDARIAVSGGATGINLPETDLTFVDGIGEQHTVFLPAINLPAGESVYFWVAADGATYFAAAAQTEPDFSSLARASVLGFVALEPGYRVEVVAEGFQLPVNIAFVPNPGSDPNDPQFYVSELYGQVKVVLNDGTVLNYATGLLNYNPTGNFPGSGEQGVTGIVVDPNNGDVIITRAHDTDGLPGGAHHPQVVRLHSTDEGRSSSGETVILDMVGETQGQSHQISDISIGPDGKLYVHNGDGFDAGTALNLNSYRGKILRMELDGAAPTDNPFYNGANGITATDYVYAYGFRNPFGGAWRESDGKLYEVENGPGSNDRLAQVNPGVSYGWDGSGGSMTVNAIYNWTTPHAPVDIAFVQPGTFAGSGFPSSNQDMAFVTESGPTWATGPQSRGKRIVKFELDANGDLVEGPTPFVEYVGQGKASAAGIVAGPDGLYFTDLYADLEFQNPTAAGARILRVRFDGTIAGDADFQADQLVGDTGLQVQFTDASTVVGVTQWAWDFGDGAASSVQNPTHTYNSPGVYDVELTVINPDGSKTAQKADHIVVGFKPEDTNQDGVVDAESDKANLIVGWQTETAELTTQAKLFAGDSNLDGIVDEFDAFRLRVALKAAVATELAGVVALHTSSLEESTISSTAQTDSTAQIRADTQASFARQTSDEQRIASRENYRPGSRRTASSELIVDRNATFRQIGRQQYAPGRRPSLQPRSQRFERVYQARLDYERVFEELGGETESRF